MRILIIKFRNIGDVLLSTPLIKNLKLNYPSSLIDFALNEETKEMIEDNLDINEILSYKRDKIKSLPFFKRALYELKFAKKIRDKKYDIVINLTEGERGAFYALFSGAKIRVGIPPKKGILKNAYTHALPKPWSKHICEASLDALDALELKKFETKVYVFSNKESRYENFIHIHPVSRWMFKCVKDEIMAKIIDFLELDLKERVILTAAPQKKEIDKINSILSLCKSSPINLSGKLSLKETIALNKKAKLFIGVDTAIMHIAAANNIPTIAFFGPSSSKNWGPWDNEEQKNRYLLNKGIQRSKNHTVIQKNWDCIPCKKDGCNGSKISDCLMDFDFDLIKEEILKRLR